jgi:hypothetical protein
MSANYYDKIDEVFEGLFEKYGYDDNLIDSKEKLIDYYEKLNEKKCLYIRDLNNKIYYTMNEKDELVQI